MNNSACLGYMILAAKYIGLPVKTIKLLEAGMRTEMDFTTEEQAEKVYKSN